MKNGELDGSRSRFKECAVLEDGFEHKHGHEQGRLKLVFLATS
jgi:hypothetical protein